MYLDANENNECLISDRFMGFDTYDESRKTVSLTIGLSQSIARGKHVLPNGAEGIVSMTTTQRSKLQQSIQRWKNKAIQRGKSLKQLNKRLKELAASRNQWKRNAQARHPQLIAVQRENRQLRQRLNAAEKNASPGLIDTLTTS